jgi:hypothetical protein
MPAIIGVSYIFSLRRPTCSTSANGPWPLRAIRRMIGLSVCLNSTRTPRWDPLLKSHPMPRVAQENKNRRPQWAAGIGGGL